jgi:hypothetical protein
MSTQLQQWLGSESAPQTKINENADALSPGAYGAKRAPATSGLTWGYYGGRWGGSTVADGTLGLTASSTNYIVVHRTTGALSVSTATTNWNDTATYGRLYKITTSASAVTAVEDHRAGPNGIHESAGAGSGDVIGPASSTNNDFVQFDGTTGKLLKDGGLSLDTDGSLTANSDARVPSQKAVKTYVDGIITGGASDVMIFKGVVDASANPNYPAADAGHVYKISVAGKIGGGSGPDVEVGDTIYCITDATASGTQAGVGANWVIAQVNVDGAYFEGGTDVMVADGGTGVSSLTAYAPLFGGTTSTGPVQSGTVGTAGQVLTSNGAGALPTFQAPTGGSGVSPSFNYKIDTGSTADSDPGAGLLKYNNGTQSSATFLYIDDVTDDTATDLSTFFASLGSSGFIHLIQSNDASKWQLWKWTATPTDGTGYWKFAVTLQANAASFADDVDVQAIFIGAGGGGGSTQGKHAIYVAAGSIRPSVSGGCAALAAIASAANQPDIMTLDFDSTTQEFAQFALVMPKSWNEGTVTYRPIWSHPAAATNFGVVWQLQGVAVSDDDAIAVAYGTAQTSTDTGGTTNDLYVGPESSAITIAGTPAAEDMVFFRVGRDPANGSDTLAVDARLHGIVLYITTDADTDA